MAVARRLADFTAALRFGDLPPDVIASACLRTLDTIGIVLAAAVGETAPSILGALDSWGAAGECAVIGAKRTTAMPLAILEDAAQRTLREVAYFPEGFSFQVGWR